MSWESAHSLLQSGLDLPVDLSRWVMREILEGRTKDSDLSSFLLELREKGETSEEVGAFVEEMYRHSAPISIGERAVDTVGTGGDGAHTINISTTSAIIAAAAGARVVKHGNRAASSKSGAADLLEALGVNITLDGEGVARTVSEIGIGFCFAQKFHPSMKYAAPVRKALGVPTVFNILGPLANPAKPQAAAIGVANDRMHLVMAQVLGDRGVDGFVFRGDDGLDEITLDGTSSILTIGNGTISSDRVDAKDFGLSNAPVSALVGGDSVENARISLSIFAGEKGAPRDACVLNAAAAIAAFDGEFDESLHDRLTKGVEKAQTAIDSGGAIEVLNKWAALSQEIASR